MNKTILFLLLICLPLCGMQAQISWPDGKKAAIVLTYDDGLKSQRDIVMPQLEAKNFRGTFFLYGQVVKDSDVPEWREASKRGHEWAITASSIPALPGRSKRPPLLFAARSNVIR